MVEVVKVSKYAKTKKEKMEKIRAMLYRYGDIPAEVVRQATRISTAPQWYAVFDNNGNVVSAGRVVKSDWYAYTVKNLFTVPKYRGKGFGSAVAKKLVMTAIRKGAKVIVADVTESNMPSKKIFVNLGFKVVSKFKWAKASKPAVILHFVLYPPTKKKRKPKIAKRTPMGYRQGGVFVPYLNEIEQSERIFDIKI